MDYNEIKSRIREIENQRTHLARERDDLKRQVDEIDKVEKDKMYLSIVGKCYKLKLTENIKSSGLEKTYAFKVLEHKQNGLYRVVRIDTRIPHGKHFHSVRDTSMYLFYTDTNRMMAKSTDTKLINKFEEITDEEFKEIFGELMEELREVINCEE